MNDKRKWAKTTFDTDNIKFKKINDDEIEVYIGEKLVGKVDSRTFIAYMCGEPFIKYLLMDLNNVEEDENIAIENFEPTKEDNDIYEIINNALLSWFNWCDMANIVE